MDDNVRWNPNVERTLISIVALAVGAVATYLSLDVQAICSSVLGG